MTVLTLLEAKIKPQRANELTRLLRELLPSSRSFAGCKSMTADLSEDSASFLLVEHWDSKEAQQKYATWRTTTDHDFSHSGTDSMETTPKSFVWSDTLMRRSGPGSSVGAVRAWLDFNAWTIRCFSVQPDGDSQPYGGCEQEPRQVLL